MTPALAGWTWSSHNDASCSNITNTDDSSWTLGVVDEYLYNTDTGLWSTVNGNTYRYDSYPPNFNQICKYTGSGNYSSLPDGNYSDLICNDALCGPHCATSGTYSDCKGSGGFIDEWTFTIGATPTPTPTPTPAPIVFASSSFEDTTSADSILYHGIIIFCLPFGFIVWYFNRKRRDKV